ncbi:MAG TPA: hypothetical protein VKO84_01575 [Gaiellaceae bacterium]|nr:hypothetical protein [Gaiellaceae bacterium]
MSVFFDVAYALVIFLALAVAGAVPGGLLGLVFPVRDRRLVLPGVALALVGWVWFGWVGGRYGISRIGLVLFSAVGAAGFVRGWLLGLDLGMRARAKRRPVV